MKLFVVAALIAAASAARLEHLERSYLPPDNNGASQGFGQNSGNSGFGSNFGQSPNAFGSGQGSNGFSASQGLGSGFGAATSNQYLPPDHGPSGSSSNGFGNFGGSSFRPGSNFGSASQGSQFNGQPQFGSAGRQYLAPQSPNPQNPPQQAFDEETGYHY